MTRVSIIVPVFNEEKTILDLLERVRAQVNEGIELEIIVVNDGSNDATPGLLAGRPDLHNRLLTLERNNGKGAAVIAGLKDASGDYVLMQDADLEYDPADYTELFLPIVRHHADIVMGSRLLAPRYTRVHYFWHKFGNRMITLFFNLLYNTTFSDIYSGYLLFRRSLIDPAELKAKGWGQQAEILGKAVRRANVIYEVPISYHGRSYEEGKKIKAIHTVPVIWWIFVNRF